MWLCNETKVEIQRKQVEKHIKGKEWKDRERRKAIFGHDEGKQRKMMMRADMRKVSQDLPRRTETDRARQTEGETHTKKNNK